MDRRRLPPPSPPPSSADEVQESKQNPHSSLPPSSHQRQHSPTAETKTSGKSFSRKQVDNLIQEAIRGAKEIDQKTIQEMIIEINTLTLQLQHQEKELQQHRTSNSSASASSIPPNKQRRTASKPSSSIQMVYAFLFGGFTMLFLSALLPWVIHLFWNLRLLQTTEEEEEE
jgi:hypothetical protein